VSCYVIAQINIHDREVYRRYEEGFDEIFGKYRGVVVLVDEDPIILEGEWPFKRTVILRFPSEDIARQWYNSEEYRKLSQYRKQAAESNVIMVKRER